MRVGSIVGWASYILQRDQHLLIYFFSFLMWKLESWVCSPIQLNYTRWKYSCSYPTQRHINKAVNFYQTCKVITVLSLILDRNLEYYQDLGRKVAFFSSGLCKYPGCAYNRLHIKDIYNNYSKTNDSETIRRFSSKVPWTVMFALTCHH